MKHILFSTEQATSRLSEMGTNLMESAIGKAFSTDEHGEISIPSAVTNDFSFFNSLQSAANAVEENRIMQALDNKQLSKRSIERLNLMVANLITMANQEYHELCEFQPEFLNNYATRSNSCFRKARNLLKRSSYTVRRSMKLFQEFTKQPKYISQRRMVASNGTEYFFAHSDLSTSTPQTHFDFAFESYSPEAQELIESIKTLMQKLEKLMALCCETLRKEITILSDLKELERIHDRQFNTLMMRAKLLIANNHIPKINKMSQLRNSRPWDKFLQEAYHVFDETEMLLYAMYQIINECKNKNINNNFEKAYLSDNEKRNAIRYAIENFDNMNPRGRGGKLSSFHLAALFIWSEIDCEQKKFYDYFWETYKGKYTNVSLSSFSEMIGLINGSKKKDKQYEEFNQYEKKYEKFVKDMEKNGFYI